MSLALAATAFLLIFPVELPDKTFIATLVLATKYRPLPVWIGVSLAFAVQTVLAVSLGGVLGRLPEQPVHLAVGLLFLIGGILLLRSATRARADTAEAAADVHAKTTAQARGWSAVGPSFLVLFAAEWGDLSQLLTASLAARHQDPVSVGIGAFLALATVSALGAALGGQLLKRLPLATIRRIGGSICLLLAVVTLLGAIGVEVPVLG